MSSVAEAAQSANLDPETSISPGATAHCPKSKTIKFSGFEFPKMSEKQPDLSHQSETRGHGASTVPPTADMSDRSVSQVPPKSTMYNSQLECSCTDTFAEPFLTQKGTSQRNSLNYIFPHESTTPFQQQRASSATWIQNKTQALTTMSNAFTGNSRSVAFSFSTITAPDRTYLSQCHEVPTYTSVNNRRQSTFPYSHNMPTSLRSSSNEDCFEPYKKLVFRVDTIFALTMSFKTPLIIYTAFEVLSWRLTETFISQYLKFERIPCQRSYPRVQQLAIRLECIC